MKLDQIVPNGKVRRVIYVIFGVIGLGLGVAQTAYSQLEMPHPDWLTVSLSVYAYLAAAGFAVSQANTPPNLVAEEPDPEVEYLGQHGSYEDLSASTEDFDEYYEDDGDGETVNVDE